MELLDELENLAGLAHMADQAKDYPNNEAYDLSIKRFEGLFQPSSYLPQLPHASTTGATITPVDTTSRFLVKLEGPLDTASKIQHVAGLLEPPPIHNGVSESGKAAKFCLINGMTKKYLLSSVAHSFDPTFIRINRAHKDLSSYSSAPTLGSDREFTLPQFRTTDPNYNYQPTQTNYPVWYFFYGTLGEPEILAWKLALAERPVLTPAVVHGGLIKTWGGKYKGLVDGPDSATVDGWAYEVASEEHEEQLRYYETDQYEVVRCEIRLMNGEEKSVKGLTFRFVGDVD
ncbi:gamma-glutamylcyclotransferase family protein [Aspergillus melleus]|uniref:gamma-glutamylcyclotransferase family protein n=1 Tax=Aspergillus melleus TaxID=138277 RepID=UPI001E8E095E|nr:uncharacterized protein LDX57_009942 [Aspergillus melleus]KAH8432303.1 hypothetical protein LDX57_009942 [Aspergillus melleus]